MTFPVRPVPEPSPPQYLLSLPPAMARAFETLERHPRPRWFAASDPPGGKLGSGGGVAHLLLSAWRETGAEGAGFSAWLNASRKLLLMAGGQSRRLPAYAAVGKLLLPCKAWRGVPGQRLDQTLLDVQLPAYERVLAHAAGSGLAGGRVLVTSGDVLLRFGDALPPLPDVDVLGLGMWVKPETAQGFGVFFCRRDRPGELAFFLQKPAPAETRRHLGEHYHLVDTGMWLLSERAVRLLLARCGWRENDGGDEPGRPLTGYELYSGLGLSLGRSPTVPDAEIGALSAAVVTLPEAEFYHFGTSRQLIESVSAIEDREQTRRAGAGWSGREPHPDQHVLNARLDFPLRQRENHTLWIENSTIPATWELAAGHVLTGVPENGWTLRLAPGQCLDVAPIGDHGFALRPYGIDDVFKGPLDDPATRWLGAPAAAWFTARGLSLAEAGLDPATDLQRAALFPVVDDALPGDDSAFVQWLFDPRPAEASEMRRRWLAAERLSAEEIGERANLVRLYEQRRANLVRVLPAFIRNHRWNAFFRLDLLATADTFASRLDPVPEPPELDPLDAVHERMFRAAVGRRRGLPDWERFEREAFGRMTEMLVGETRLAPVEPRCNLLEDQILWARSPARIDLAGGWSDTPPYCLEYGGAVLNVAVDLNGQPPIQVFAKRCDEPVLVIRSIDLGVERRLDTFADVGDFQRPDNFSLAKAALALAGFHPRFHAVPDRYPTLRDQLRDFGAGVELTLLSAVPKGSGLGTSSILAATVLGALGELGGLGWDRQALFQRTLVLEQLLTTGGGWQDQAGGLYRGIKLIETAPALSQRPVVRWLPEHLLEEGLRAGTVLLYYTGLTRLAKNILQEIVRGMFLNSRPHLDLLDEIRAHAGRTFSALQSGSWETLCAAVRHSWDLNQRLDAGTNPPAVAAILARVQDWLAAVKLPGAGGGGYLLFLAKDPVAAVRLRRELEDHPPNANARFVDATLSPTGFALTKS